MDEPDWRSAMATKESTVSWRKDIFVPSDIMTR